MVEPWDVAVSAFLGVCLSVVPFIIGVGISYSIIKRMDRKRGR